VTGNNYPKFMELVNESYNVNFAAGILAWDQETYMPPGGAAERAQQMATMAKVYHEYLTSQTMKGYLEELRSPSVFETLGIEEQVNVREIGWQYDRESALPAELVKEVAHHSALSLEAWKEAREKDDFTLFQPFLEKMVDLKCKVADHIGYEDVPYDALLDEYEPGMTSREVTRVFNDLRDKLVPIVAKIAASDVKPDEGILTQEFDLATQRDFGIKVVSELGYDFKYGRLDESAHPFTSGAIQDVRITTRFSENDIRPALFANIHEAGHAMYQQGIDATKYGSPMGDVVSLGLHESQSRLWENLVGRSMPFWRHYFPKLQATFPKQFGNVSIDDFYAAANLVKPSLIRVEADEVTYNLHILIRFDIEQKMMHNEVPISEIPALWNEKYEEYLGITPPNNALGCLQDIHWSMGIQGYFPTYALGNLMAVQMWRQINKDIPDLTGQIEAGQFSELLGWLNRKVHRMGRTYHANEMIKHLTGEPMNADYFIGYLKEKFGPIYGVQF
jgi:carboxypeptidase Taq